MDIKLNKRLRQISAFIEKDDRVIDIGCDHGLLGIYLYQKVGNKYIISSDIKQKPLLKAQENLEKYHLTNEIILRQADGLEGVSKEVDTVIMAGMGGLTIIDILSSLEKYPQIKKLVISPNNDFYLTRKKITHLGFKITEEVMVYENNKYYLVSKYERGLSKTDYYFGKLVVTEPGTINYYRYMQNKNKQLLKEIPKRYFIKRWRIMYINYLIKQRIFRDN